MCQESCWSWRSQLASKHCTQPCPWCPISSLHHLMLVPVLVLEQGSGWCCSLSYCLTNWDSVLAKVQGWAIKICSSLKSAIKLVAHEWVYLPGCRGKWAQPLIKEKVLVPDRFFLCFIFSITLKSVCIFLMQAVSTLVRNSFYLLPCKPLWSTVNWQKKKQNVIHETALVCERIQTDPWLLKRCS